MSETFIRKAVLSDLPYLYEICLKTGDSGNDATALYHDPYVIGQYYVAPYLIFPAGICFVVEKDYRPQGYIVAVPDTIAFKRWMEYEWLPPLRQRYPYPVPMELIRCEDEGQILMKFHECQVPDNEAAYESWVKDYPAHLHIDLLPTLQGKGFGRFLINCLCTELARQGVPGVHLGVGIKNQNAVAFYRKIGFSVLREEHWGFAMGKRTSEQGIVNSEK
jgi:GNAT superfamily N-acetyltransferase